MIDVLGDPRLPRLLSHAAHEFRTPLSVILGYLRMVLNAPTGLDAKYQRMLQDIEKSATKLSGLVNEMSDLSKLERGEVRLQEKPVDLNAMLSSAIAALPEIPDRQIGVKVEAGEQQTTVHGDSVWLQRAFTSIFFALCREVIDGDHLVVRQRQGTFNDKAAAWLTVAEPQHIDAVESLGTFNEWRGGCGLSLITARTIIDAHRGAIFSPSARLTLEPSGWKSVDGLRAAAVIALPLS